MAATTDRANAPTSPSAAEFDEWKCVHSELEIPIYDLMRMLRAAANLQDETDQDLRSSARLIVELAAQKAEERNERYQRNWPGKGMNSRIDGEGSPLTQKAVILQEIAVCERRLKETRMKAEALSEEDACERN